MLRIDRVTAHMDVLPATGAEDSQLPAGADTAAIVANPQAREHIKELVREALSDHLRELERRGVV